MIQLCTAVVTSLLRSPVPSARVVRRNKKRQRWEKKREEIFKTSTRQSGAAVVQYVAKQYCKASPFLQRLEIPSLAPTIAFPGPGLASSPPFGLTTASRPGPAPRRRRPLFFRGASRRRALRGAPHVFPRPHRRAKLRPTPTRLREGTLALFGMLVHAMNSKF